MYVLKFFNTEILGAESSKIIETRTVAAKNAYLMSFSFCLSILSAELL